MHCQGYGDTKQKYSYYFVRQGHMGYSCFSGGSMLRVGSKAFPGSSAVPSIQRTDGGLHVDLLA